MRAPGRGETIPLCRCGSRGSEMELYYEWQGSEMLTATFSTAPSLPPLADILYASALPGEAISGFCGLLAPGLF
jgi:hypothetical protein